MRVLVILLMIFSLPGFMAATPGIAVDAPRPGEALQGVVSITGSSDLPGFVSMEIDFSYHADPRQTWFLIAEEQQPVSGGTLASWDTTTITDGDYDLRLLVSLKDGTAQQLVVSGLRVRNYTAIETSTPAPTSTITPTGTFAPTGTFVATVGVAPAKTNTAVPVTSTPIPTKTPFPPNPAQLSQADYWTGLSEAGMIVLVLFAAMGLYQLIRRRRREG